MDIKQYIFEIVLPERCIICGKLIFSETDSFPLCSSCTDKLIPLEEVVCSHCGLPLISETDLCIKCRVLESSYLSNRSLFRYSGNIKEVIYQYKFRNRKKISIYFAKLISEILKESYASSIIVPVPGRRIVRRKKGWEHMELIGRTLKTKYKLPVTNLLVRKGRKAQKTLSREKRAENLRKTIVLRRGSIPIPESVVLLDDVYTTGTTINECAVILKSAGVREIHSLTIAID